MVCTGLVLYRKLHHDIFFQNKKDLETKTEIVKVRKGTATNNKLLKKVFDPTEQDEKRNKFDNESK